MEGTFNIPYIYKYVNRFAFPFNEIFSPSVKLAPKDRTSGTHWGIINTVKRIPYVKFDPAFAVG